MKLLLTISIFLMISYNCMAQMTVINNTAYNLEWLDNVTELPELKGCIINVNYIPKSIYNKIKDKGYMNKNGKFINIFVKHRLIPKNINIIILHELSHAIDIINGDLWISPDRKTVVYKRKTRDRNHNRHALHEIAAQKNALRLYALIFKEKYIAYLR